MGDEIIAVMLFLWFLTLIVLESSHGEIERKIEKEVEDVKKLLKKLLEERC